MANHYENKMTNLKAAKECINAAIKNHKNHNDISCDVAVHNAIECLKSYQKKGD